MNTILKRSTAFHPQTDGQTERVNQCLETYLRCFCNEQPNKWHQFIPWAELWYNTTFHSSTRTTPFQTVYGRPPPPLISYGDKKTPNDEVEALLKERDLAISALKENLTIAQNRMKKFADSKRRELKFKVGDEVYLKLRPYRQRSLARKRAEKLAPKYYGPYRIIETIGEVAYRLDLPPEASIHNVFHISQLKLKLGNQHNVQIQQPQLTAEFELQLWPETVLGIRWSPELGANEWLVKWKGLPDSEATWESVYSMNQQFPSFHLEDKVILEPRAKRKNRHLLEVARSLILSTSLSSYLWGVIVLTATHLINWMSSRVLHFQTPLEFLKSHIPLPASFLMFLFGYSGAQPMFITMTLTQLSLPLGLRHVFLLVTLCTNEAINAFICLLSESEEFNWAISLESTTPTLVTLSSPDPHNTVLPMNQVPWKTYYRRNLRKEVESSTIQLAPIQDSEPLRDQVLILRSFQMDRAVMMGMSHGRNESPGKNKTWELCTFPKGYKTVGCKWMFTIKYKADGTLDKHKARLVAKGLTQTYRVNYFETFSPVANLNIARVLLSVVVNKE
ncbi:Transposon Ty3-G Gag-Pol polyprotein [Cucumis melo var. makuwa]|uniref:Transposon Ty3-G Gag-Pol polyprotein n=1 Tax=Cucumis melo var. makuwa TaxID=1194695 RepID=A0A5D3CH10_CUCMM|nr:Transposon Ty3-G Gag-Pol polyprotein [Cucumis melo var. makuwa]